MKRVSKKERVKLFGKPEELRKFGNSRFVEITRDRKKKVKFICEYCNKEYFEKLEL